MTFEYRDPDGEKLVVQPHERKKDGQQVVELYPASLGYQAAVHIPLDRVEEVVAGIRDAARTAAGRPAGPLTHTAAANATAWAIAHEKAATDRAARTASGQQPERAPCNDTGACNGGPCAHPGAQPPCGSRSLPTYSGNVVHCVLDAGHSKQCQSATEYPYVSWPNPSNGEGWRAVGQQPCACGHLQDRHLSCCTECPCIGYVPVWPPQTTGPAATPAVGQPAEAQATDRAAVLREAIEAAEGELLHDDTRTPEDEAYNQGVRDAAAAIASLTVEDETR